MREKRILSLIINLIFPLAGVSTDIYMPSLPAMANYFDVSKSTIQLTLTSYVVAMGIMQLIAGPISDAFGRKPLIIIALLVQLFTVFGVLYVDNIALVILFRFIQGVGAAFMMVPARAVINDVFTGNELKKQFNYSTISFALAPILAPYLGGYLQEYFNWQYNFIFIIGYIIVALLVVIFFFKETVKNVSKLSPKSFMTNYCIILRNGKFIRSALFVSFVMGYFAMFSISGPFVIQVGMKLSPDRYGQIALLMGLAWFLGNTLNRFMMDVSEDKKVEYALWGSLAASVIMLIISLQGISTVIGVVIPTFVMIFLSGLIFPIYISNALAIFEKLSASANGCLFSLTWLSFSCFTIIATFLKASSQLPLSISFSILSLFLILFYYAVVKNKA